METFQRLRILDVCFSNENEPIPAEENLNENEYTFEEKYSVDPPISNRQNERKRQRRISRAVQRIFYRS